MSLRQFVHNIIILIVFVGYAIFQYLGWDISNPSLPLFFRIMPSTYLLVVATFIALSHYRLQFITIEKRMLFMLIIAFMISFFRSRTVAEANVVTCLLPGVLISICMAYLNNEKDKLFVQKTLYYFYITECAICIFEAVTHFRFFPPIYSAGAIDVLVDDYNDVLGQFRSTALHGHPLSNALLIDIIMSFFMITPYFHEKKKAKLIILGLAALLSLNERSSIYVMVLFSALYLLKTYTKSNVSSGFKMVLLILPILIFLGGQYLIQNYGIGGRLLLQEELESSTEGRLNMIPALFSLPIFDIVIGVDLNDFKRNLEILCGGHMENYWIQYIAYYGLLLFIPILIMYCKILGKYIPANFYEKIIVIGVFGIASSTNNSLACQIPAISFFILCGYSYLNDTKYHQLQNNYTYET